MLDATIITLMPEENRGVFDARTETTGKDLLVTVESVGMNEYYKALGEGLEPEQVFVIADWADYSGEKLVLWDNVPYSVIRATRRGMTMRLTCERVAFNG